jgi:cytochrome c
MKGTLVAAVAALLTLEGHGLAAEGDATQGQRIFNACSACHSLRRDQNMTGPSLGGLWNRKAGTLASFSRYSSAMKSAGQETCKSARSPAPSGAVRAWS